MIAARVTLDSSSTTVRVRIQVLRPYGVIEKLLELRPDKFTLDVHSWTFWTFRSDPEYDQSHCYRENALRILKLVDSLLGLQDRTELFPTNLDTFRTENPSQWYWTRFGQIHKHHIVTGCCLQFRNWSKFYTTVN
jgi:hypothetical protein